jgi:hypothetical protein
MPYGLYVSGSRGKEPTAKNLMTANWLIEAGAGQGVLAAIPYGRDGDRARVVDS